MNNILNLLNEENFKVLKINVEYSGDEGYGAGFDEDWNSDFQMLIVTKKNYFNEKDFELFLEHNQLSQENINEFKIYVLKDITNNVIDYIELDLKIKKYENYKTGITEKEYFELYDKYLDLNFDIDSELKDSLILK